MLLTTVNFSRTHRVWAPNLSVILGSKVDQAEEVTNDGDGLGDGRWFAWIPLGARGIIEQKVKKWSKQ